MNNLKLHTTADVARLAEVSPRRIRALAVAGQIAGIRAGRDWLFTTEQVKAFKKIARPVGRPRKTPSKTPK